MDQQVQETKPVALPKVEEPEVDRKTALLQKKTKNKGRLSPEEERELDAILDAEELERKRGALIHKLREKADTHGRKEIVRVKREVTDRVALFGQLKMEEMTGIESRFRDALKALDGRTKKAMQLVQEEHNAGRSEFVRDRDQRAKEVNEKYSGQFDEAERELESKISDIGVAVVNFQQCVASLSLEQLQELEKSGSVSLTDESGEKESLVFPGQPPP